MRSCCIAQGTISDLRKNIMEHNVKKKNVYKCITGPLGFTAEIDITLHINFNKKKHSWHVTYWIYCVLIRLYMQKQVVDLLFSRQ